MVTKYSYGFILTRAEKYVLSSPPAARGSPINHGAGDGRHDKRKSEERVMEKLPAEVTQARRFGKARSAQSTALLEDYVELIADLLVSAGEARPTDIARRLGVSHATAVKTISRLKRAGLATARPYRGVFLTEKGQALADRVRVRHRLVVDLLRALGVPTESAEADAEGIEHYVSEITLKAFAQFLKSRG
jgi:DtxR family transcriptional regulator, manganese transport regulator